MNWIPNKSWFVTPVNIFLVSPCEQNCIWNKIFSKNISGATAVKINSLDVPDAVRAGAEVRLTCDYNLEVQSHKALNQISDGRSRSKGSCRKYLSSLRKCNFSCRHQSAARPINILLMFLFVSKLTPLVGGHCIYLKSKVIILQMYFAFNSFRFIFAFD